jgi:DNA-binding NarL/FixJ family response regulator
LKPIRLAIVDDHQLMRSGLRLLLQTESDIEVVGEAATAHEAVALVRSESPDVVLMDWSMPGETGLSATERIVQEQLPSKIIRGSMFDSAGFVRQARQVGASGYLVKGRSPEELLRVIRQVADGAPFVANSDSTDERSEDGDEMPGSAIEELTPRQIEILRLLAIGKTTKEIASILFISEKTVEHHRTNIRRTTGINDTAKLVLFAVRHGIVTPADIEDSVGA